ncbi:PREDICTED: protein FAM53A [Elephantulus edwardii]|uniref:protein FAM53A n=1 Tax=Elephantulus edwardii TaxID=28737 RepID=UPI0003F0D9B5|nr:PREDICTED: protein FAM53A [Elephantulus edwardii]
MVTLITEKLQNQSLDDLARKTYDGSLCPTEKLNRSGGIFPFELHADKSPWKVVSGGRPGRSEGPPVPAFAFSPGPFAAVHSMGRSQPCVLDERPGRRKRRRDEDTRWPRPALDFLKMTRTLKNSKSLCSLDYDDEDEDDAHAKTVVSSPCDSQDLPSSATPGSSPARVLRPWTPRDSESAGVPSDGDSAEEEEGIFPLDCADLDLEQIENN